MRFKTEQSEHGGAALRGGCPEQKSETCCSYSQPRAADGACWRHCLPKQSKWGLEGNISEAKNLHGKLSGSSCLLPQTPQLETSRKSDLRGSTFSLLPKHWPQNHGTV